MVHQHHAVFLSCIDEKQCVDLEFYSQEDRSVIRRRCAPMDFGPSRRAAAKEDRYHVWDFESDTGPHSLSLNPTQIVSITATDQKFDPADFVTWSTSAHPWFYPRQWGIYS